MSIDTRYMCAHVSAIPGYNDSSVTLGSLAATRKFRPPYLRVRRRILLSLSSSSLSPLTHVFICRKKHERARVRLRENTWARSNL